MTFLPIPTVALDGALVHCEAAGLRLGDEVTIMAPLEIRWGRSSPWEQPSPASMTLLLWDPHGAWAIRLRDRTALGVPVTAQWDHEGTTQTFFRGTTVAGHAEPAGHSTDDGERGWWVTLTVADASARLGNMPFLYRGRPRETQGTRVGWVRTAVQQAGSQIANLQVPDEYLATYCGPAPLEGANTMDAVNATYESMGIKWAFDPNRNTIIPVTRPPSGVALQGFLMTQGHGTTLYISGAGRTDPVAGEPSHASVVVDGCTTSTESPLTFNSEGEINVVQVTYPDVTNEHNEIITVASLNVTPEYRLEFSTWFDRYQDTIPLAQLALDTAIADAALPAHPPIVVDTRHSGGFLSARQAKGLTLPAETPRPLWIAGSQFARWVDAPPSYTPIGGTITFDGEHWRIESRLAWTPGHAVTTPATWASFDPAITWGESAGHQLHNSITWWDARHLIDGTIYSEDS